MGKEGPDLFDYTKYSRRLWCLNNLPGLETYQLLVLRAINERSYGQPFVTMTKREIADYWNGKSTSTVLRAIKGLEQLGFLSCERVINQHGQQANEYQLIWSNLFAYANGERIESDGSVIESTEVDTSSKLGNSPRVCEQRGECHTDTGGVSEKHGGGIREARPTIFLNQNNKNLLLLNEGEGEALKILKEVGVLFGLNDLRTALQNGATVSDIRAIAAFYANQPEGKFGPGAVCLKLRSWLPGERAEDNWPSPNPAWLKQQERTKQAEKSAQIAHQAAQREAHKKVRENVPDELESRYGPMLETMSKNEIWQLIIDSGYSASYQKTWLREGLKSKSIRKLALDQLAKLQELKGSTYGESKNCND